MSSQEDQVLNRIVDVLQEHPEGDELLQKVLEDPVVQQALESRGSDEAPAGLFTDYTSPSLYPGDELDAFTDTDSTTSSFNEVPNPSPYASDSDVSYDSDGTY